MSEIIIHRPSSDLELSIEIQLLHKITSYLKIYEYPEAKFHEILGTFINQLAIEDGYKQEMIRRFGVEFEDKLDEYVENFTKSGHTGITDNLKRKFSNLGS